MLKPGTFTNRKYLKLFIAGILGWIVSLLGGMADSIIAGLYLDAEAVSAVSLISPIEEVYYFVSLLISVGCAIHYSKTQGAFQYEQAQKIAGMGFFLSILLGVVMCAALLIGRDAILRFYGVEGAIYSYAETYFVPIIFLAGLYPILWTVYNLVLYDGDEKVILLTDILMAVSNTVISLVLVQSMGIAGLGYGTLISNVIGLLCLVVHFLKKSNSIHFKMYFAWKDLLDTLKASSATSLTTLYIGVIDIVFNKVVIEKFSADYLTAYAVINVVMNFACVLACAIGAGVIFVSVAYGENNPYALKRVMKHTHKYTLGTGIAMTVLMEFLAPYWPALYAIEDPAIFSVAVFAGRIIPIFFLAAGFVYTYLGYYPAVDRVVEGNLLILSYMLIGPIVIAAPLCSVSFNAMSVGFAVTPVFAILVTLIYLLVTKQLKNAPYLVSASDETEAHYDLRLEPESIVAVRDRIGAFLGENHVEGNLINKIEMVFEDSMVFIMNRNRKKVICECTILLNDQHIRLITKDNGVIFDLVQEADNSVNLQAYILARMMTSSREATNTVTTSFNRNICIWER